MRGSRRGPATATPPQHGHSLPGFLEKPPHVSCAAWLPEDIRLLPEPRDHAAPAAQNCCVASGFPAWPLSSNPPPAQTLTPEPELRKRAFVFLSVSKNRREMCVRKRRAHTPCYTHSALGIALGFSFIAWPSDAGLLSSLVLSRCRLCPSVASSLVQWRPPHLSLLLTLSQLITESRPVCLYTHQIVPSGWAQLNTVLSYVNDISIKPLFRH